ncbi:MAG: benzoyl-CoA-dihydrodiol lyase [Actinomycetia bacterium]|nr:benzoyl-CoA-dihydrodiol lyase [Actinomycetes bacterium]
MIEFDTQPDRYQHWKLRVEPPLATLTLAVTPEAPAIGDYELKLNSYDIGVDIELADAVRRIRFEHPDVRSVIVTGGLDGVFCAGANIRMLAGADHPHKVNFCKFTNETRLELEEASRQSGVKFLAACNGATSGGGYELALACEHILLVDDRNSAVSLPEVPLLGVLPGTGGLTRVTDKRHVRRDRADVFATRAEGVRGDEALDWGLIDELAPRTGFEQAARDRATALAEASPRTTTGPGATLAPLERTLTPDTVTYRHVATTIDRAARTAELTVTVSPQPGWLLQAARELDDLLCHLRFNEPEIGILSIHTQGSVDDALALDRELAHGFADGVDHAARETALLWARVLSRLDLTARSLIAVIDPGSCFTGFLAELALAADRTYMLDGIFEDRDETLPAAELVLTTNNFGPLPMANGISRLESRFWGDRAAHDQAAAVAGKGLSAADALDLGLVTFTPDDLDWDDDLRLAVEERAAFSPDALTAMEANHRFAGPETMATKIFARLSAWQNWVFIRPSASGPEGALVLYGTGTRPTYDLRRT